jgi:hypothetical protein
VKALANQEVGDYVNRNFVSTYLKIGTFRVANGQKQGGNVASYFCTPGGKVLHAIAGPVDSQTFLREARWVMDSWKLALLDSGNNLARLPNYFKKFHYDRLQSDFGFDPRSARLPYQFQSMQQLAMYFNRTALNNQGRVHLLLTAYPLSELRSIYPIVFQNILGQTVTSTPVLEANAAGGNQGVPLGHWRGGNGPMAARMPAGAGLPASGLGMVDRPRVEEDREIKRQEQVVRARQSPPMTEVWSGQSLNDLLIDLQRLQERGVKPSDVSIDEKTLDQISVTTGKAGGSIGLLRQNSLIWPAMIRRERFEDDRKRIEELLSIAVEQGSRGMVETQVVDTAARALLLLSDHLRLGENVDAMDYMEAKRYVRHLQDAVEALRRPEAAKLMAGEYAARGRSVEELVKNMTASGLRFAPALPGQEAAYAALHRALASYNLRAYGMEEQ